MWLGCVGLWFGLRGISVWTAFVKLWLVVWGVGFQCASWFAAEQVILGDAYVRGSGDCRNGRKRMIGVSTMWRARRGFVVWGAGEVGEEPRRVGQGVTGG